MHKEAGRYVCRIFIEKAQKSRSHNIRTSTLEKKANLKQFQIMQSILQLDTTLRYYRIKLNFKIKSQTRALMINYIFTYSSTISDSLPIFGTAYFSVFFRIGLFEKAVTRKDWTLKMLYFEKVLFENALPNGHRKIPPL